MGWRLKERMGVHIEEVCWAEQRGGEGAWEPPDEKWGHQLDVHVHDIAN